MKTIRIVSVFVLLVMVLALLPGVAVAKRPFPETTNNLSFPAIALDGFAITPIITPSFTVPYAGLYPGLTLDEITWLNANGPWYPQKTTGNVWQAEYVTQTTENVTYIDWGDNIESVNPKVRRPFRLEVTLYKQLSTTMTAYTMAVLEYPSSSSELQGTNKTTYENSFATVISPQPKLLVQFLGDSVPVLTWDTTKSAWVLPDAVAPLIIPVKFGPELNVGGKYIYGASTGGWKPTQPGYYRITFYIPTGSGVNLAQAQIGNYADFSTTIPVTILSEEGAATPVVDTTNNLTYVDVIATR